MRGLDSCALWPWGRMLCLLVGLLSLPFSLPVSQAQTSQAQTAALNTLPVFKSDQASRPQVRGTWLTTTANDALASPEHTARTM
ncbi:MAG: hypothetical protein ACKOER_11065, partial [Betaproteobacteria bacterium]